MSRTIIEDRNCKLNMETLKPIQDYVLIKEIKKETTVGGIVLPKNSNAELCIGRIVSLGNGILNFKHGGMLPFNLSPGDVVLTMDYMGDRAQVRNGDYRFVRDHGIWARVTLKDEKSLDIKHLEPRINCVLVELRDETKMANGVLYYPKEQNAESCNRQATVIEVGPGPWDADTGKRRPCEVKHGDKVVMTRYAGADVVVSGNKFRLLQEQDIRCIVEEEK